MTEETKPQTEETQEPNEPQTEQVNKLLIDNPSDFKFHAAYLAYSETWDKINSTTHKKRTKLHSNVIIQRRNGILKLLQNARRLQKRRHQTL